jgi:hypothetical protein
MNFVALKMLVGDRAKYEILNVFFTELSIRASAVRLAVRGEQLICPEEQA